MCSFINGCEKYVKHVNPKITRNIKAIAISVKLDIDDIKFLTYN